MPIRDGSEEAGCWSLFPVCDQRTWEDGAFCHAGEPCPGRLPTLLSAQTTMRVIRARLRLEANGMQEEFVQEEGFWRPPQGVGGLLDGGVCFPVAQQLAVEGLAVEPEHLGGERPVPTDGPENVEDIAPFDLFHGNQFGGIVASQHHL